MDRQTEKAILIPIVIILIVLMLMFITQKQLIDDLRVRNQILLEMLDKANSTLDKLYGESMTLKGINAQEIRENPQAIIDIMQEEANQ